MLYLVKQVLRAWIVCNFCLLTLLSLYKSALSCDVQLRFDRQYLAFTFPPSPRWKRLVVHSVTFLDSIYPGWKPTFSTNNSQHNRPHWYPLDCFHGSLEWTGLVMLIVVFLVHFSLKFSVWFHVVDLPAYPSIVDCTLNTQYRVLSWLLWCWRDSFSWYDQSLGNTLQLCKVRSFYVITAVVVKLSILQWFWDHPIKFGEEMLSVGPKSSKGLVAPSSEC